MAAPHNASSGSGAAWTQAKSPPAIPSNVQASKLPPLLLTLRIDDGSFRYFNDLRKRHFPPAINYVPAHISLFHRLPGEEWERIASMVGETCLHQPRFAVSITGLRSLGRGVAFTMRSGPLCDLRAKLADHFAAWLTPQDKQRFEPHVTVQNKVSPSEAATLLSVLRSQFEPFEVLATGVQCWHYLDGPWELVQEFVFAP